LTAHFIVAGSQKLVLESHCPVQDCPSVGRRAQTLWVVGVVWTQFNPPAQKSPPEQGCPAAMRLTHVPVDVVTSYRQKVPLTQSPETEQSPLSGIGAMVGAQVPAQHMTEKSQLRMSHSADTHSFPAKQGDPAAAVPVKICAHAGEEATLDRSLRLHDVERPASRHLAAAAPSNFVLPKLTSSPSWPRP